MLLVLVKLVVNVCTRRKLQFLSGLFFCSSYLCRYCVGDNKWRFVGVYGWANGEEKYRAWQVIHHLYDDSSFPICDFNEILSYDEKGGIEIEGK